MYLATHLVADTAEVAASAIAWHILASPEVQIAATNVGLRHLDEDGTGLRFRYWVFYQLERLTYPLSLLLPVLFQA